MPKGKSFWPPDWRGLILALSPRTRVILLASGCFLSGGFVALLALFLLTVQGRDEPDLWHTTQLEEEFTASCGDVSFADYLAREDRLFEEMEREIYAKSGAAQPGEVHRYRRGSQADPTSQPDNPNRSFDWLPEGEPRCGVLLLHGMSDSPYSLRALGRSLRDEGARVVGLRLPGHGTVPAGLRGMHRRDLIAATHLAMRHLRDQLGDRPLFLVGYSNGGALAVRYALESLEEESLPSVSGLVLISPAIGVGRLAGLAAWQGRLGHWLGMEKLAWISLSAEYDPCKYHSFAVNAGDQVHRLTVDISRQFDRLGRQGRLESFPPVLAFQSAVDATVSTPALIAGLFAQLPGRRHELVLFDLNRVGQIEGFLAQDPRQELTDRVLATEKPFVVTVLANREPQSLALELRRYPGDRRAPEISDPGLSWPEGVYSLSHVCLPFPPDDPLYGNGPGQDHESDHFQIGNLALRGEKGVLAVAPVDQLRLRWNPFYDWMEARIIDFVRDCGGGEARP